MHRPHHFTGFLSPWETLVQYSPVSGHGQIQDWDSYNAVSPPGSTCLSSRKREGSSQDDLLTENYVFPETNPQHSHASKFLARGQTCGHRKEPAAPVGIWCCYSLKSDGTKSQNHRSGLAATELPVSCVLSHTSQGLNSRGIRGSAEGGCVQVSWSCSSISQLLLWNGRDVNGKQH